MAYPTSHERCVADTIMNRHFTAVRRHSWWLENLVQTWSTTPLGRSVSLSRVLAAQLFTAHNTAMECHKIGGRSKRGV